MSPRPPLPRKVGVMTPQLLWERRPYICSSVCLPVDLSVCGQNAKIAIFSKTKQFLLQRPIGSRTWAFQRTHYWIPKIQDG